MVVQGSMNGLRRLDRFSVDYEGIIHAHSVREMCIQELPHIDIR